MYAEHGGSRTPQPAIREAAIPRFRPIKITAPAAITGARVLEPIQGYASELCQPPRTAIIGSLIVRCSLPTGS